MTFGRVISAFSTKNKNKQLKLENEEHEYFRFVATLGDGIASSSHILCDGDVSDYYVDIDLITSNPQNCEYISNEFVKCINSLQDNSRYKPDLLGFIEKDGVGTIGAMRFAIDLSIKTGIPNLTIRNNKLIPCERVKVPSSYINQKVPADRRLDGKIVLLIDDVSTSGTELRQAISSIQRAGGEVRDVILYYSRLENKNIENFSKEGVSIYSLIRPSDAIYLVTSDLSNYQDIPDSNVCKIRKVLLSNDKTVEITNEREEILAKLS
jgi:Orotate phosphoribosyltransferase